MLRTLLVTSALYSVNAACDDLTFDDGAVWNDDGGVDYNCNDWYSKPGKCDKDGAKYANEGKTANDACCVCGGGSEPASSTSGTSTCVVDNEWTHSKYNDNCYDYIEGDSMQYECDAQAKIHCCTCPDVVEEISEDFCTDLKVSAAPWHDSYGEDYGCGYYAAKSNRCEKDGDKYEWKGLTANSACCVCGGGEQGGTCTDLSNSDGSGSPWHDDGGAKYNCAYYATGNRCEDEGGEYADEAGVNAQEACCVCGGGAADGTTEGDVVDMEPKPDEGDDIKTEWLGGTEFQNKKHMQGGFILYWNTDTTSKMLTLGLLSPPGVDGWIALGFSPSGAMAGSDAFVGWFDDNDEPVITDKHLKNQSPSGITDDARQQMTEPKLLKWNSRLAMIVSRPWASEDGGVEVRADSEFAQLIYSHGKISKKCPMPFCNHEADRRWTAELALTAPAGMSLYTLNRGNADEPCQGPAELECQESLYCYHEDAMDLDVWDADYTTYGTCQNPQTEEDPDQYTDDWSGEQTVYTNDGGFENKQRMRGGFVVLWTLNKISPPGSFGPDDSVSVAVVSTAPDKQGWIGFGWSPNGEMKGSDVVIGWHDDNLNEWHIGDYYLGAQISNKNVEANKQDLVNARTIKKNGQTAIQFERKLTPADSVQVLEGLVHVIYGSGPTPDMDDKQYIPYHRFRAKEDIEFVPLPDDLADANSVGLRELCGGPANIACKKTLTCNLFDQSMIDRVAQMQGGNKNASNSSSTMSSNSWNSEERKNATGFTTASSWGHGGRGSSSSSSSSSTTSTSSAKEQGRKQSWGELFSNSSNLVGRGLCIAETDVGRWANWAENMNIDGVKAVREDNWEHYLRLRWGIDLYWNLLDGNEDIISKSDDNSNAVYVKMAVVAAVGPGWLGLGLGTEGAMLGANAVIGWKDNGNATNQRIAEYYLEQKLPWEIRPISETTRPGMELSNMEIITAGAESALIVERPLIPSNGVAPILPGEKTPIIYAVGSTPRPSDDFFGYHRFREVSFIDFYEQA